MKRQWKWPSSVSPRWLVHVLGLFAVGVGTYFWSYRLQQLQPTAAPVEKAPVVHRADPAAQAVTAWLGPGQIRTNVSVIGLMHRRDRAVAVLAINGAPPKAFLVGDTLMHNVTLASIDSSSVTIDRAGIPTRFAAPLRPDYGPPGIVRVP